MYLPSTWETDENYSWRLRQWKTNWDHTQAQILKSYLTQDITGIQLEMNSSELTNLKLLSDLSAAYVGFRSHPKAISGEHINTVNSNTITFNLYPLTWCTATPSHIPVLYLLLKMMNESRRERKTNYYLRILLKDREVQREECAAQLIV